MSLPTASFFNLPRNQVPSDDPCPICLSGVNDDKGMLWVAHKDITNRDQERKNDLIHPIHKDCAEKAHLVFITCCGQDVNVDVNSLSCLTHSEDQSIKDIGDEVRNAIEYKKNSDSLKMRVGLLMGLICLAASVAMIAPVILIGGFPLIVACAALGGCGLLALIGFPLVSKLLGNGTNYDMLEKHEDEFISYIASSSDHYSQFKQEGISNLAKGFADTLKA